MKTNKEIHDNKIKIRVIGNVHLLPETTQKCLKELEDATKDYDQYEVNIALAYGGRAELVSAIKKISEKIKRGKITAEQINEELIMRNLELPEDIDFVIRTGGEHRTSGFFIWQTDYAEYFFIDKYFPEFEKEDFVNAIKSFSERERRFGK